MFEQVPVQAWILIAIAAAGYAPARYIYDYIAHSPSKRDITQPREDLSWRTSGQLARALTLVGALALLAVFIFTPAALQLAQSPSFWPILTGAIGGWALVSVARGFSVGRIQPFVRGFDETYERQSQPKRYWTSMAWNTFFGCLCIWLPFQMFEQAGADRCLNVGTAYSQREALSACNKLIGERDRTDDDFADLVAARGFAYHELGDHQKAMIDYTNAIRLDPLDSYSHYNRGLIYEQLGDSRRAVTDYSAAIRLRPNDADAHLNRGLIFLDNGKLDEAVTDFTRAHELKPKNPWPLANRGITYVWKNDHARAEKDFKAVWAIDPSNPVLLRGEALLNMKAGNMQAAVQYLTAVLKIEPGNRWALRMRAAAHEQLGNQEKSDEDKDELWRLSKR